MFEVILYNWQLLFNAQVVTYVQTMYQLIMYTLKLILKSLHNYNLY